MPGWTRHTGQAVHLPLENVDTDQLIPARFMSRPRSDGYGDYLLYDVRRNDDGVLSPDFPINQNAGASILIAGGNFGSGSSREAAVYALVDAGFQVVIAPSFGDIFSSNAVNNGVCPARMSREGIARLTDAMAGTFVVDLEKRTINSDIATVSFELDDSWATKLINGWDDIDLTLQHADQIAQYRAQRSKQNWAWPQN
ncbi:3-isopropylmalate dehydratase small subunit [Sulfitobacter aestuariivivens]|uniref:3-isopropylmalate dehydratase n=1 Tax=Sulfitobacter aestuariivivens TaxID=2766981 RepID=A0A927D5C7_9RHOB|nr:3-isopropylmalate dehydratase small subunit [Sulfitobacter aestuariivivens]